MKNKNTYLILLWVGTEPPIFSLTVKCATNCVTETILLSIYSSSHHASSCSHLTAMNVTNKNKMFSEVMSGFELQNGATMIQYSIHSVWDHANFFAVRLLKHKSKVSCAHLKRRCRTRSSVIRCDFQFMWQIMKFSAIMKEIS